MSIGPFAVAIVAIICWAVVELVNGPKGKKKSKEDIQDMENMKRHIADLQERIQVLEKIVTDEKYNLHREFENLKKNDAA